MRIIERLEEHYEVQEVPFGRSYKWCPECVVVECDCGERRTFEMSTLVGSEAVCECGADLTTEIEEKQENHRQGALGQMLKDQEATHQPWLHDARAQAEQYLRDEANYPEGSPWRYDDVTSRATDDDERNVR